MDAGGARAEDPVVGEEPGGGTAVGGLAGLVLRGLFGEVDMEGGPPSLGPCGHGGELPGGHGAYGVDGRADQGVVACP